MRIIASILIALIFTLFGLLYFQGDLNIGKINLIGFDNTFETDLSFVKTAADYTFFVPGKIYDVSKEGIKSFTGIQDKEIYLLITFFFYFIFSGTLIFFLIFFPKTDDQVYLVLGTIFAYYLIIELFI